MSNTHTARETLGPRLKEAREYVGFSTENVARHLGLSQAAMSRIESGSYQRDNSTHRTCGGMARCS